MQQLSGPLSEQKMKKNWIILDFVGKFRQLTRSAAILWSRNALLSPKNLNCDHLMKIVGLVAEIVDDRSFARAESKRNWVILNILQPIQAAYVVKNLRSHCVI